MDGGAGGGRRRDGRGRRDRRDRRRGPKEGGAAAGGGAEEKKPIILAKPKTVAEDTNEEEWPSIGGGSSLVGGGNGGGSGGPTPKRINSPVPSGVSPSTHHHHPQSSSASGAAAAASSTSHPPTPTHVAVNIERRQRSAAGVGGIVGSAAGPTTTMGIAASTANTVAAGSSSSKAYQHPHSRERSTAAAAAGGGDGGDVDEENSGQGGFESGLRIIGDNMEWLDTPMPNLKDNTNFLVVGAIGYQGSGKSTLLSMIGGNECMDMYRQYIFRPASREALESCKHQTMGVHMYTTSDRVILLDTQPVLSPAIMDDIIRCDKRYSFQYKTIENFMEVESIELAAWLFSVCHVVIIVSDWFMDTSLLRFLRCAQMMMPPSPSASSPDGLVSGSSTAAAAAGKQRKTSIVFAQQRSKFDDFQPSHLHERCRFLRRMFANTRLNICDGFNLSMLSPEYYPQYLHGNDGLMSSANKHGSKLKKSATGYASASSATPTSSHFPARKEADPDRNGQEEGCFAGGVNYFPFPELKLRTQSKMADKDEKQSSLMSVPEYEYLMKLFRISLRSMARPSFLPSTSGPSNNLRSNNPTMATVEETVRIDILRKILKAAEEEKQHWENLLELSTDLNQWMNMNVYLSNSI